ncbi:hypothetical protein ACFS5N_01250 [Mucilaginibacter ximonensis]|uniref:DUF3575 domain-containing protein n=1 Tax=Mucilaginibacter ximonensis TaxID=538021 RepID=A0ABW5Y706_9SPHI
MLNNNYKLFLLFLFILQADFALAQNKPDTHPNQIFVSPIRLIDPINPGIQIGYQRNYAEKWATVVEVARMTQITPDFYYADYKGWRYQLEQKYFLPNTDDLKFRTYVAVDLAYLNVNFNHNETFAADTGRNTPTYSEKVHVLKTRLAGNAKYGMQIALKRFVFDFAAGVGGVYRKVKYTGMSNPNAVYRYTGIDMNFDSEGSKPGDDLLPNVALDVRIMYTF